VVVARRGKLVLERYFSGDDERWVDESVPFSPGHLHDVRSISKSVTSLLVGIARGEGKFPPLQSSVVDFFREYADLRTPENPRITFQHLLTMSHGLVCDESKPWDDPTNNERRMLEAKDPYRYVMKQPMALPPGVLFNYCGGATSLLGAVLAKGVGRRIDAYAAEKLFAPLAIKDFEWLGFTGSTEIAAFGGLQLRPRKERCTPLTTLARDALKAWLKEPIRYEAKALFPNVHGGRLSADSVQALLSKYVRVAKESCPSLASKRVSPHVLRHSAAMELLQAGVDCSVIALWLGHEAIETTQTYLHAHLALKEAALSKLKPYKRSKRTRFQPNDHLLGFLEAL
jgi:CubicO group peptidase (beta-lactamase class C family)